jgi:hypothetical protein
VTRGPRLTIVPCELDEANAFVAEHHRHHQPIIRDRFNIAVATDDGVIRGVVMVGRPVARHRQDGWTCEVLRNCTDGTQNACSALYAAAWRACKAMGYRRLGTYILASENGGSLVAAGWKLVGERGGGTWDHQSRPRVDKHPTEPKLLWEAV